MNYTVEGEKRIQAESISGFINSSNCPACALLHCTKPYVSALLRQYAVYLGEFHIFVSALVAVVANKRGKGGAG